jgi:fructose-specific phosphotransferase system IIA component
MELADILKPQNIKVPLESHEKAAVIRELVDLLAQNKDTTDADNLYKAVMERETTRTTGIGGGLAIPHGKCKDVKGLVMAVGKPAVPIDYASVDNQPVRIVILMASPPDQTGPHIQALARISRVMTTDRFRESLFNAKNAEEIYDTIKNSSGK